ncbi:MAG: HMA2 domain-containing protein [Halochromatium sp.]
MLTKLLNMRSVLDKIENDCSTMSSTLLALIIMFDAFSPSQEPRLSSSQAPTAVQPMVAVRRMQCLRVRHRAAGRLRLSVPMLRSDPALASRLPDALESATGIRAVRVNPACGSIVIHHAFEALPEDRLDAHVAGLLQPWLGIQAVSRQGTTRQAANQRGMVRQRIAPPSGGRECVRARSRKRPPLTWPLADLSRYPRVEARVEGGRGTRQSRAVAKAPPIAPWAAWPAVARRERCWLCALNQALLRSLFRFSLRCWWSERRRELARLAARLQASRWNRFWPL